jgi:hypothetical protein
VRRSATMMGMRALFIVPLVVVVACGTYTAATVEAQDAGRDSAVADGPVSEPPPNAIYVSVAAGNDANEGRSKDKPLKTLGAAFALIETSKLEGFDVVACRGTYEEPALKSRRASALRGGYNCSTWTRAESFGKKGKFSDPNQTRIIGNASSEALVVETGPAFTLEGFDIEGRAGNSKAAVSLRGLGKVAVSNARIYGAGAVDGKSIAGATYGLDVTRAQLTVQDSEFYGGAGDNANAPDSGARGSVAVQLTDCSGDFGTSVVQAGTGKGIYASMGMVIGAATAPAGTLVVHDTTILGSDVVGQGNAGALAWGFTGIYVATEGKFVFSNLFIQGAETKSVGGTQSGTIGMNLHAADVTILNSRINPGQVSSTGTLTWGYCQGIIAYPSRTMTLTNTAVLADCGTLVGVQNTSNIAYQALLGTSVLRHNTFIAMGRGGAYPQNTASVFAAGGAALALENNFLGAGNGSVINLYGCQGSKLERLRANALWGAAGISVLTAAESSCANGTWVDTAPKTLVPDASGFAPTTLLGLLEPSDSAMFAVALRGGALRPNASPTGCALSRGGIDLLADVPTDIEGKPRSARPAIGAWEASSTPSCP